jgi:fatty-acid peroxygenase
VVLTRGICRWAGIPLDDEEAGPLARDLVAMAYGFATAGPRRWLARGARGQQEAQLARLVESVRSGSVGAPDSVVDQVCGHRDGTSEPLDARTAAVELLNLVRPTVAVCWFVAFAAHPLHRWPENQERLRSRDDLS